MGVALAALAGYPTSSSGRGRGTGSGAQHQHRHDYHDQHREVQTGVDARADRYGGEHDAGSDQPAPGWSGAERTPGGCYPGQKHGDAAGQRQR